jgi:hypothetical protein
MHVTAPSLHHLEDLLATLRRLPPRMTLFWDVAYGRAPLAALAPDSLQATWHQERGLRLMLALALVVPEPRLREQFERVCADGQIADVVDLVQPMVLARRPPPPARRTIRDVAHAIIELLGGDRAALASPPAPPRPAPPRTRGALDR